MPDEINPYLIYKIVPLGEWRSACLDGIYMGSRDDLRDGFIHFSTQTQLAETARRHFCGQSDLVLLAFETAALGDRLKWEPSRGGALFPHHYGPLATTTAVWSRDLALLADGVPDVQGVLQQETK